MFGTKNADGRQAALPNIWSVPIFVPRLIASTAVSLAATCLLIVLARVLTARGFQPFHIFHHSLKDF